jgi:hypothetical protein
MTPTPGQVAAFLGQPDDATVSLAGQHLPVVTEFVRAYTRGRGFTDGEPGDDLEAVIVSATARLVSNPALNRVETDGVYSVTPGRLDGFTLPELAVLNLHRRRTA